VSDYSAAPHEIAALSFELRSRDRCAKLRVR
jgi:hypothetical protein